jgi:hypothetical protein
MQMFSVVVALFVLVAPSASNAQALGQILDPAAHGLKRLEPLVLGTEQDNTHMAPKEYRLKVGQGYRWKVIATPGAEYAFVAPAFLRNVWLRKVEVGEVEIKSATLDELEFENGGEAEIFFVAIRPGTYEFGSRGLMQRGVKGTIIVEGGARGLMQRGVKGTIIVEGGGAAAPSAGKAKAEPKAEPEPKPATEPKAEPEKP